MSVLDDATIIYVPGVYKTSAVALQKPISAGSVSSLTFARASTGTRVNSAGLIESVATNVPRVDYLNGSSGALLLEPARTNLLTYSEQFDNAAWLKIATGTGIAPVVTANATIAPDGTTTADKIVFDLNGGTTTSDQSVINQALIGISTIAYSGTVYLRGENGGEAVLFRHVTGAYTELTLTTSWQRFELVDTYASGIRKFELGLRGGIVGGLNDTATVYAWGAQIEAGAYPTSYIPTVASTVTRSAETLSKTGLANLLGDAEGTLYFEASYFDTTISNYFTLSDGTTSDRVFLRLRDGLSAEYGLINSSGGSVTGNFSGAAANDTYYKVAMRYATNDIAVYLNGSSVANGSSVSTFSNGELTRLGLDDGSGSNFFYGKLKALAVWDRALTDTELEDLTT